MSGISPVSFSASFSSSANAAAPANSGAAPQAPESATTPTELAGAPGITASAEAEAGGGLGDLASALLVAMLLGGENEDEGSQTAKLLLGLAALGMMAPQAGGSFSFHASFNAAEAPNAYAEMGNASSGASGAGGAIDASA